MTELPGQLQRLRGMSFGVIGRNFKSRFPLAGTYDQNWMDNVFPFLPALR